MLVSAPVLAAASIHLCDVWTNRCLTLMQGISSHNKKGSAYLFWLISSHISLYPEIYNFSSMNSYLFQSSFSFQMEHVFILWSKLLILSIVSCKTLTIWLLKEYIDGTKNFIKIQLVSLNVWSEFRLYWIFQLHKSFHSRFSTLPYIPPLGQGLQFGKIISIFSVKCLAQ